MNMQCSCKDFKINMPKINAPMVLEAVRRGQKGYDGKIIKYCPWCGNKLKNDKEIEPKWKILFKRILKSKIWAENRGK